MIRLPLDFRKLIRFNKPLEREQHAIDDVAHFGLVIVSEVKRNNRRAMIDRAVTRDKALLNFRNESGVGDENANEEFDWIELMDRAHTCHETTIAKRNPG